MAGLCFGLAFAPGDSLQYKPNNRVVDTQTSVEDGNDEHMVAAQLANNNSWRSGDIAMVDAADAISEAGSSLSSSSFSSGELHRLIETHAPEILSGSLDLCEAPSSLGDSSIDSYGEISDGDDEPEQRAATPQSESGIDILDKYAFNLNRDAYSHRVPRHLTTGTTLNVSRIHPQNASLAQYRLKLGETGEKEVCPSVLPLQNEVGPSFWNSVECVWVGMLPSPASTQHSSTTDTTSLVGANNHGSDSLDSKMQKSHKKKTQISASIMDLDEDDMTVMPFDRNALRVVAKKSNKVTKSWFLYALINPSPTNRLCQGYKVSMDEVYFFKGFRDDSAKTYKPRKQATQEQIKSKIFPALPSPTTPDSSGSHFKEKSDAMLTETAAQSKVDEATGGLGLIRKTPSFIPSAPQDIESERPVLRLSATCQPLDSPQKTPLLAHTATTKTAKISDDPVISAMMEFIYKARVRLNNSSEDSTEGKEYLSDPIECMAKTIAEGNMGDLEGRDYDDMDLDLEPEKDSAFVIGGQNNIDDDQGYPDHAIAATDPNWDCHRKNLVEIFNNHQANHPLKLSAEDGKTVFPENVKSVLFQDADGQLLDKHGKRLQAGTAGSVISESYYSNDNDHATDEPDWPEEASKLTMKITKIVDRLATNADIAGLEQALTMLKSLEHGIRPPGFSVVGLYLNVPPEGDKKSCIDVEEVLNLFPDLSHEVECDQDILDWMVRSLQETGQSVDIELLQPFVIAYTKAFRREFSGTPRDKVQMNQVERVELLCRARDDAEALLRERKGEEKLPKGEEKVWNGYTS